jgi:hypothetical protein
MYYTIKESFSNYKKVYIFLFVLLLFVSIIFYLKTKVVWNMMGILLYGLTTFIPLFILNGVVQLSASDGYGISPKLFTTLYGCILVLRIILAVVLLLFVN